MRNHTLFGYLRLVLLPGGPIDAGAIAVKGYTLGISHTTAREGEFSHVNTRADIFVVNVHEAISECELEIVAFASRISEVAFAGIFIAGETCARAVGADGCVIETEVGKGGSGIRPD